MTSGTREDETNAVYSFLKEWKLTEKVQSLSFDTSFNTGRFAKVWKVNFVEKFYGFLVTIF